jgi:hypothetical protein
MRNLALMLISLGVVLILAGGALWIAAKLNLPVGRLPGDINLRGRNWSVSIPLITCLILSILLTLLLNFFFRR